MNPTNPDRAGEEPRPDPPGASEPTQVGAMIVLNLISLVASAYLGLLVVESREVRSSNHADLALRAFGYPILLMQALFILPFCFFELRAHLARRPRRWALALLAFCCLMPIASLAAILLGT